MEAMSGGAGAHTIGQARGSGLRVRPVRAGAVIAVALAIGFAVWLMLRDDSSSASTSPVPKGAKAVPISVSGLHTIASLGVTIYWVGEKPGSRYELTKTNDNRVFIRYLPRGVRVGSDKPYLTVGTYPVKDAFALTNRLAARSTSVRVGTTENSVAFYNRERPANVFVAYKGVDYQVEVFDPSADRARELVTSGVLATVG
jgi:hypothetical protein